MAIMFIVGKNNKILTVIFVLLTMMFLVGATQIANRTANKNIVSKNSLESLKSCALTFVDEASLNTKSSWQKNIEKNPELFIKINSAEFVVLNEKK
ncbi:hypothetical protein AAEX28_00165 [Lentisphaerota bacterium WC36G]|nr:hypothetical protein LJT99_03045 [Lentisphaerae bacterium WC36]